MLNFGAAKVSQLDVKDLYNAIKQKETCVILDVRTPLEYERGKVEGSINLPVDKIRAEVEEVIPDKEKKVYVYCLSGSRSVIAVEIMIKLGYKNVFDIKSGLLAWRVNKFPIV